jgi:hypothetical protein
MYTDWLCLTTKKIFPMQSMSWRIQFGIRFKWESGFTYDSSKSAEIESVFFINKTQNVERENCEIQFF